MVTFAFQSQVCFSMSKARPDGQVICFNPERVHLCIGQHGDEGVRRWIFFVYKQGVVIEFFYVSKRQVDANRERERKVLVVTVCSGGPGTEDGTETGSIDGRSTVVDLLPSSSQFLTFVFQSQV